MLSGECCVQQQTVDKWMAGPVASLEVIQLSNLFYITILSQI